MDMIGGGLSLSKKSSGRPLLPERGSADSRELAAVPGFNAVSRSNFEDSPRVLEDFVAEGLAGHSPDSTLEAGGHVRGISFEDFVRNPAQQVDASQEDIIQGLIAEVRNVVSGGTATSLDTDAKTNPKLAWVEQPLFSGIVAGVIVLNMLALWVETDSPGLPWWFSLNVVFLVFFIVEFGLRLAHRGAYNLLLISARRRWIVYDVMVMVLGVIDLIMASTMCGGGCDGGADMGLSASDVYTPGFSTGAPGLLFTPALQDDDSHRMLTSSSDPFAAGPIVRAFQLSRLLRLIRILRMDTSLLSFINLLMSMLGTFAWILAVMFLFLFVLAIILTRLVGHGLAVTTDDADLMDELKKMYCSIPTTLFTLFQLTTADDWAKIANPLIAVNPIWRLFFIFFITFMSWTMLSLLTAVASETMITESKRVKGIEAKRDELKREGVIDLLIERFDSADVDASGTLDKDEFIRLMSEESLKNELRLHAVNYEPREFEKIWKTFDIDDSNELTIKELIDGFTFLTQGLETKQVAKIGYALKSFHLNINRDMDGLEEGIDKLARQQEEVLKRVLVQQEFYKAQWTHFLWQQHKEAVDHGAGSSVSGPPGNTPLAASGSPRG